MGISIWGWGSTSITTTGWGGSIVIDYIPVLFGKYLYGGAWTWVITRDNVEIRSQDSSTVFFRTKPSSIPVRSPGDITPTERSQGWPWQTG
ncbi:hypothetical protein LCGC14_0537230 [marine sediment metagenome]|uniref:Uncharacterized protein n=1 Tax=marine sediment metagenome TaxID=412755 RepID=A0A0F9V208_9ZZZZ